MKKLYGLFSILLLVLAAMPLVIADSDNYQIDKIEIDGISTDGVVYLERGEKASVAVWFSGVDDGDEDAAETTDSVRLKVWISGYEYGDIEDETEIFQIIEGNNYRKVLRLEIPEDIDASQEYTLHVRLSDKVGYVENEYNVRIEEQRHNLQIMDVIFNPDLEIEAGKTLFASVRVENLGYKDESDIKVMVSVPELGLSTRTYIDELVTEENENEDEKNSGSTEDLFLRIPEYANGAYDLKVTVEYDRGHKTIEKTYTLIVKGKEVKEEGVVVTLDKQGAKIARGQGAVYKLMFTNLGQESIELSLVMDDVSGWASARVDPKSLLIGPEETGEMFIYVSANENAELGTHTFGVDVKVDGSVVKHYNIESEVTAPQKVDTWKNLRTGLEIGFIVLLIILVILGLIIAARKIGGGSESNIEEPEGKSYY